MVVVSFLVAVLAFTFALAAFLQSRRSGAVILELRRLVQARGVWTMDVSDRQDWLMNSSDGRVRAVGVFVVNRGTVTSSVRLRAFLDEQKVGESTSHAIQAGAGDELSVLFVRPLPLHSVLGLELVDSTGRVAAVASVDLCDAT
jgi:hypothetical protein